MSRPVLSARDLQGLSLDELQELRREFCACEEVVQGAIENRLASVSSREPSRSHPGQLSGRACGRKSPR